MVFREDSMTLDLSVFELASVGKLILEVIERPTAMWHRVEISLIVQLSRFVHDPLAFLIASRIPFSQVVLIIQSVFLENMRGEELLVAFIKDIRTFFGLELLQFLLEMGVLRPGCRLIVGDPCGFDVFNGRVGDCDVFADCTHGYSN